MSDNNSLNEKYQKFEPEEEAVTGSSDENIKKQKAKKEKKKKEPKAPKEKKVKEPKEKKVKEPKEKKAKEPKAPKEKKRRAEKKSENVSLPEISENENAVTENIAVAEAEAAPQSEQPTEQISDVNIAEAVSAPVKTGRQREEIVFDNSVHRENPKKQKSKKEKKAKPEKTPKEKKIKEPKEKKAKEAKSKKVKEPKEKKPHEPLEKKDIATIAVSVIAFVLTVCVGFLAYFNSRTDEKKIQLVSKISFLGKIFPEYVSDPNKIGLDDEKNKLSDIQIARDGIYANLIQTDFPEVFYGINSDYSVQYYQYSDNRMIPVKYTDTVDLKVDMGSGILNVKMNYIKNGEYVSGVSVFTSNGDDDTNYFYDLVVFKLTVLPLKYNREGHALLLASTDKSALEGNDSLWSESFDVNLNDGSMTRFLSVINRNIDEKGSGVFDFCILNRAGYTSTAQKIPFISSREYPSGSGMQDIFVKNGNKDERLAMNIYGRYFTADSSKLVYLRRTTTGFDVIHNINGEEQIVKSFYGFMDTAYMVNGDYLLSKEDGRLYNIVTGKDYSLVGYSMNAMSFIVSADGRYVVMMGTVKNAVDYQIHIFDLQTGEYAKFKDKNYAPHGTLCFIDGKTVLYTAVEPNQGYEYVILNAEKAFEKKQ